MRKILFCSLVSVVAYSGYMWSNHPEVVQETLDVADQTLPPLPDLTSLVQKVAPDVTKSVDADMAKQSLRATSSKYRESQKHKKPSAQISSPDREDFQIMKDTLLKVSTKSRSQAKNSGDDRWITSLSGAQLEVKQTSHRQLKRCEANDHCARNQKESGISVVGVVVDTKKMVQTSPQLVDGIIGLGDAIDTPAVYIH